MVPQNMLLICKQKRMFLKKTIKFATALDLIKCNSSNNRDHRTCAHIPELPSHISTKIELMIFLSLISFFFLYKLIKEPCTWRM